MGYLDAITNIKKFLVTRRNQFMYKIFISDISVVLFIRIVI